MQDRRLKSAARHLVRLVRIGVLLVSFSALGWVGYKSVIYLRTSPRFEVEKLAVSGLKRVGEDEVLAKAGFEVGANAFTANLEEIRQRVEELPWVRHATVQRVLPDQIIINVVEREPIGLA